MGVKRRSLSSNARSPLSVSNEPARLRRAKIVAHPADTSGEPKKSTEQFRSRPSDRNLEVLRAVLDGETKGVARNSIIRATKAKNNFGRILESVLQGGRVVITKHDMPKAILISVDEFNELFGATELALGTLRGEFDALLAGMQTPGARGAMKSAFHASLKELGEAAVIAARKRG
jgi:antitoxin Phd